MVVMEWIAAAIMVACVVSFFFLYRKWYKMFKKDEAGRKGFIQLRKEMDKSFLDAVKKYDNERNEYYELFLAKANNVHRDRIAKNSKRKKR